MNQILDTDYDNYVLMYGCNQIFWGVPIYLHNAWLLSRTNSLPSETIEKMKAVLHQKVPDYNLEV